VSKVQPKITAKEYRAYVEGKGGIAALLPVSVPDKGTGKPPKGGKGNVKDKVRAPSVVGRSSKRTGKYNARGREVNGRFIASEAQAKRYEQLLVMEKLGRPTSTA
jgi:hypothetical protein